MAGRTAPSGNGRLRLSYRRGASELKCLLGRLRGQSRHRFIFTQARRRAGHTDRHRYCLVQTTMEAAKVQADHDSAQQLFSVDTDGQHAELAYRLEGERMTITHTQVPDAIAGRGIAAALVEAALAHARQQGYTVVPACSYAEAYIRRHQQFQDLLA
ncbi:putative GNAT family acetyltransferase [Xanthomonas arboricola]|nr:putative GNAT family acetyltransferase [Xanthomonas euroxanthea]